MSDSSNEYLNKKVKVIFDPLITQMLMDKPEKPVCF